MLLNGRKDMPEFMDVAPLSVREHEHALTGLARLNRASLASVPLKRAIRRLAHDSPRPTIELLDVATGAGDIPMALARWSRRKSLDLRLQACDISATAVAFAAQRCRHEGLDVQYFVADAKQLDRPAQFDIVTCSLFLHHLEQAAAVDLLARMARAARRLVLVADLRRSISGLFLAYAATRVLTRSSIVHLDGPISVRRAFTVREVQKLALQAGLYGAAVTPSFPCRLLLSWWRKTS